MYLLLNSPEGAASFVTHEMVTVALCLFGGSKRLERIFADAFGELLVNFCVGLSRHWNPRKVDFISPEVCVDIVPFFF